MDISKLAEMLEDAADGGMQISTSVCAVLLMLP